MHVRAPWMPRATPPLSTSFFLLLAFLPVVSAFLVVPLNTDDLNRSEVCFLRCAAACVKKESGKGGNVLDSCKHACASYENPNLCPSDDLFNTTCWDECHDLGVSNVFGPAAPSYLRATSKNGEFTAQWAPEPAAVLYALHYKAATEEAAGRFRRVMLSINTTATSNINPTGEFCDAYYLRVVAASPDGVSAFSEEALVDGPRPNVSPKLTVKSMRYSPEQYVSDFYTANGTIIITFEFDDQGWPLGYNDLEISPMFHHISCVEPDLSKGIPMPDFHGTNRPRQIETRLGADMMYRRCKFLYYTQSARSKRCGSEGSVLQPPPEDLLILDIDCNTVDANPCVRVEVIPGPVCGQITDFEYTVLNKTADPNNKNASLTVNATFVPLPRIHEGPTKYYMALVGHASKFHNADEETFLGVNQTDVVINATNCMKFAPDGNCLMQTNGTVLISGLHLDTFYGVTLCAVKDIRNLTIPPIDGGEMKSVKPHSSKIEIDSKRYRKAPIAWFIVLAVFLALVAVGVCIGAIVYIRKTRRYKTYMNRKMAEIQRENELRPYTDLPRKTDIWEIDRRQVDVHHSKKLGQGAFGAVYEGKLIGRSLGHRDANSPLGINLMRSENCKVAIKTLPETADGTAKEEFLAEISLMKSIGYHERLVNLLACVTLSEPLLLVVEHCSDGDLLHFLRLRCKYMMKLDEQGINYAEPRPEDNVDLAFIVTLKQLLMFAVQISYGLEYLSQKGFVHRDVAARNVLVNNKQECKIGDFGLCRQMNADYSNYMGRGGRLPLKWMSPEAIRSYEFATKSDVWAFGILLFEVITLGGVPYPDWPAERVLEKLDAGERLAKPDNCPDHIFEVMCDCWEADPAARPDFSVLRQRLATFLEEVTEEYSYLKLDAQRDYYNFHSEDGGGQVEIKKDTPAKLPVKKANGVDNPLFTGGDVNGVTSAV